MRRLVTLGPIGRMPAPGTCASVCAFGMIFLLHEAHVSWFVYGMLVVMLFSVGLLSIARCLPLYDSQDPREIVIDEVIGCFITCMWVPYTFHNACIGFVLFQGRSCCVGYSC